MPANSKRLFIAINLPLHVRQELAAVSRFAQHPHIRWTPQENLHVTIHFIGQVELDAVDPIKEKIAVITSGTSSFSMTVEKIKVVRKNRNPVMIWAALEGNEIFTRLALQLQNDLPGDDSKKPNPHITLARIKGSSKNRSFYASPQPSPSGEGVSGRIFRTALKRGKGLEMPALPEIRKIPFDVQNIELMESVNSPSGAVYKVVETFNLKGL